MNLLRSSLAALLLATTASLAAQTAPLPDNRPGQTSAVQPAGTVQPPRDLQPLIGTSGVNPAPPAAAPAPPRVRTSPHETISAKFDGNRVIIVYGRPHTKDPKTGQPRKIWGALVPAGKPWRTGADEATLLITQQPLDLGGTALPAGAYTLYTLLAEDGSAQLLINKLIGQWGADPYDATQEFARIALKKDSLEPAVEQFTMAIEKNPAGGWVLKLAWENTQFSVPCTVKK